MSEALDAIRKYKKANKLVRLAFHKNGPKSYKRGQGTLLATLSQMGGSATQKQIVERDFMSRGALKDIVRKAQRNGYVEIVEHEDAKTYVIQLTDAGKELAQKREAAHERVAEDVLSCLTVEERAQLDAINEKLILAMKERGISAKDKGHVHSKRPKHRH